MGSLLFQEAMEVAQCFQGTACQGRPMQMDDSPRDAGRPSLSGIRWVAHCNLGLCM